MRVLVADDDPVGRQMMATAIELLGHDVTQVTDGREALDAFLAQRYEILVLDWMMPQMDGIAVARGIRGLELGHSVATEDLIEDRARPVEASPMILLATAFDDPHLVASALEAGVDDYMIKPASMAEIRARIAIAVERYDLRQRAEARELALRRERGRAEALSRARARFLANMSHELRTPLNGMVGMADFILSGTVASEHLEAVEIIRASALSLDVIINDILDLTQVDEGRISIDPRPFDLRLLVDQVAKLYTTRAQRSGLELRSAVLDDVPSYLIGDQTRIRQILSNLVNNALKYTKEGKVDLSVRVVDTGNVPPRYRFAVSDTGPGIDDELRRQLFQRFQRGDNEEEPGHGLGLAICRGLADLMGGKLDLESTVGEGSTFWFDLPLATAQSLQDDAGTQIRVPNRPVAALVVEDDRFNQIVAQRLLERAGCRVTLAENGRVGVQRYQEARPDIVFMDVQMPVMNGLESARRLRQLEATDPPRVPIVGLTASSVEGARQRCIEAGMDGYLQKPVQLSAIVDALVRFLPDAYR